ncbi:DedA family protein [Streptomyces sp. NPDC092296]|uniref:DedA family protein n=1 Tax=Streptomyces sp. NPDC092296 TaxID=3366012 RepID=UPI00380A227F
MDTAALIGSSWIFILAFAAVLGDAFLPVIPSGSMVIVAVLKTSDLDGAPLLLALGVAIASFVGDLILLRIARRGAPWVQARLDRRPQWAGATTKVQQALETRAARTVIVARFVPAGRTILDLAMGGSANPRRFVRWSAVSALIWAAYIVTLGWLNSHWFDTAWLSFAVSCAAATAVSASVARLIRRQRRIAPTS